MNGQDARLRVGDRVYYQGKLMSGRVPNQFRGFAIRQAGESDLDAVLRTINRRLKQKGLSVGHHATMGDNAYRFSVWGRLARHTPVQEHFSDYRVEIEIGGRTATRS